MMNTDSWLARDTSGSVFIRALIRVSGSLDNRLWDTAAAGPVGCWLRSSASTHLFSSSLPHRSESGSMERTGVATAADILRWLTKRSIDLIRLVFLLLYLSHITTLAGSHSAGMRFRFDDGAACAHWSIRSNPANIYSSFIGQWDALRSHWLKWMSVKAQVFRFPQLWYWM